MFSTDDTIVAIATPPGRGGLGIVRISGPLALRIANRLTTHARPFVPRYATLTVVRRLDAAGSAVPIDQAMVTFFPAPHSYTGEDVVELSAHGSPVVLLTIVQATVDAGARAARAGEFTLRAFLHGRIDLPQAEAVIDLIDAVTPRQAAVAFDQLQGTLTRAIGAIDSELFDLIARLEASVDFPDEGYHFVDTAALQAALARITMRLNSLRAAGRQGRLIREGRVVAIVGGPNVGKSSLFNALVGASRAIVTAVPGTTRDLVTETVDIYGLRLTLVDTAGVRDTVDVVEAEGVNRSLGAARIADLIVLVRDGTSSAMAPAITGPLLHVDNKSDHPEFKITPDVVAVSALTGDGLDALRAAIAKRLGGINSVECPQITNIRHLGLIDAALSAIQDATLALSQAGGALSEEFVLADLQRARSALEEITGRRTTDDLLQHVFERFCIGK
jgi:tRNA modification GTPase